MTSRDGSRIEMALYVDDGYVVDFGSPLADAELARLHTRITIAVKDAKSFLGNNITIGAPNNTMGNLAWFLISSRRFHASAGGCSASYRTWGPTRRLQGVYMCRTLGLFVPLVFVPL